LGVRLSAQTLSMVSLALINSPAKATASPEEGADAGRQQSPTTPG
jgi:hypothetical protein